VLVYNRDIDGNAIDSDGVIIPKPENCVGVIINSTTVTFFTEISLYLQYIEQLNQEP
jgi:hypothetical protein